MQHSQQKKWLNTKEAAEYLGLGVGSLEKLRLYGRSPIYSKPTPRRVVYDIADLEAWLAAHKRRSTSDNGGAA